MIYTGDMKLIVGLGNPEARYANTRHNTGFTVVETLVHQYDGQWQTKTKLMSSLSEVVVANQPVLFLKSSLYYNESGQSVRAVKDFYKIDTANILVIHDELALPFGTIRTRLGGSDAGNNGIKSINSHIGIDYARIRVGIQNEHSGMQDDSHFVLGKFTKTELDTFSHITTQCNHIVQEFASDIFTPTSYTI